MRRRILDPSPYRAVMSERSRWVFSWEVRLGWAKQCWPRHSDSPWTFQVCTKISWCTATANSGPRDEPRRRRCRTILSVGGTLGVTGNQICCGADLYPQVSEREVQDRLAPLSELVQVHCRSVDSFGRWEKRMRSDPLCGSARLNSLVPVAERLNSELFEPLNFDCRACSAGRCVTSARPRSLRESDR